MGVLSLTDRTMLSTARRSLRETAFLRSAESSLRAVSSLSMLPPRLKSSNLFEYYTQRAPTQFMYCPLFARSVYFNRA